MDVRRAFFVYCRGKNLEVLCAPGDNVMKIIDEWDSMETGYTKKDSTALSFMLKPVTSYPLRLERKIMDIFAVQIYFLAVCGCVYFVNLRRLEMLWKDFIW